MKEKLFTDTLKRNHYNVTPERLKIFNILESEKSPCSIDKLVFLASKSVDRSTVYRNLELFEKLGVTKRVFSGFKYQVELSDMFKPHHHHMTCTNCGSITPFRESKTLETQLKNLERDHKFKATAHSLELSGLCKNCF